MVKFFGVRYVDGKLMIFKANADGAFNDNPGVAVPDWAVDIREVMILAILGAASICLIWKDCISEAMILLVGLMGYVTGRTIPSPTKRKMRKIA